MERMTRDKFFTFFSRFIRVQLDWSQIVAETEICINLVSDYEALSGLYLPWYFNQDGKKVSYKATDAKPLEVRGSGQIFSALPEGKRSFINATAQWFLMNDGPLQLIVPTYQIDETRRVALDGCSRLVAFDLVQPDSFGIMEVMLKGPLDANVLKDLYYWQHHAS
jgi:hypothetical protein